MHKRLPAQRRLELSDVLAAELHAQLQLRQTTRTEVDIVKDNEDAARQQVIHRIHEEAPERSALCLSGGGIRSASFSLGVLQELARAGLLKQFDYLSTVSGGGYIGGWLSAWIHRRDRHVERVETELATIPETTLGPEPEQIRHLRTFSNYLAPRLGLFSADTWALVATVVRNLLLNWLILLSVFTAVLVLPCFSPWLVSAQPGPGALRFLLVTGFILVGIALIYPPLDLPGLGNLRGNQRRFLLLFLLPLVGGLLCLVVWWAGFRNTAPVLWAGWAGNVDSRHAEAGLWFPKGLWLGGARSAMIWMTATCLGGSLWGWIIYLLRGRKQSSIMQSAAKIVFLTLQSVVVGALGGFAMAGLAHAFHDPARAASSYILCAPPLALAFFFLLVTLFIGLSSFQLEDEDREWWGRALGWIAIAVVGWIVPHGLMLYATRAVSENAGAWWQSIYTTAGGLTGLAAAIYGFSTKSPAKKESAGRNPMGALLPVVGALAFFLVLGSGVSWLVRTTVFEQAQRRSAREALEQVAQASTATPSSAAPQATTSTTAPAIPQLPRVNPDVLGSLYEPTTHKQFIKALFIPLIAILVTLSMGFCINVNKFSLHTMYRNRLIRAFLGASRPTGRETGSNRVQAGRKPHPFTGFDPEDNLDMHELGVGKLFHVVNMALNVVKGEELAWQERKAETFTATPLHCGNWRVGYRPSKDYGGKISLGTALAISGAAANPNAGYHSSPVVTFLLALFNLRLGWWLGNPGKNSWQRQGPIHAAWPLLAEALGATRENSVYVNLSDGGHFENLGVYEMILRRCHSILAVDGGCDVEYSFEDLGNLIRKARIDFGIDIEMRLSRLIPLREEGKRFASSAEGPLLYCAIGTIHYEAVDAGATPGQLIYLKPMLTEDVPADVANYHTGHPDFPHETTADQFFGESQLESYRALGAHQLRQICGKGWNHGQSLGAFFSQARNYAGTGLKVEAQALEHGPATSESSFEARRDCC
jgi:hypothetical protein